MKFFKQQNLKIIIFCLVLFVLGGIQFSIAKEAKIKVAIILGNELNIFYKSLAGFKKTISENVPYKTFLLPQEKEEVKKVVNNIKLAAPEVICVFGPRAAQIAKMYFAKKRIVYTFVANPERYNLVGPRIYGVALNISPDKQLSHLKKILPKVKKVGI